MRERYIDIVKGISILSIVFLHYENGIIPGWLNDFIGSFMITAFYVTAGWVCAMRPQTMTTKELARKRWKQLCVPYLWWTVIILAFEILLFAFGYYDFKYIAREVYKSVSLRGIGTLWFLPALFFGEIIWNNLKNKKAYIIIVAFILTVCYQYFYGKIFGGQSTEIYRIIDAPFKTLSNALYAWCGIMFGSLSYQYSDKMLLHCSKYIVFCVGIVTFIFGFITDMYLPSSLWLLWSYLSPWFTPLGLLLMTKPLQNSKIFDFFDYWGRNSLNLMVTHYSIIMVMFTIIAVKLFEYPFYGWITIICFLLSLPIQYSLIWLINKYFNFTLGK